MANLKELKNKINSVKGTQKTTKAMKLVSTAKLRRAEVALKNSREYAKKIDELVCSIACKISSIKDLEHRAFLTEAPKKVDIIFITADKGLCGGFNHQTIKAVSNLLKEYKEKNIKARLKGIGRKGIEYFKFNEYELADERIGLSATPNYEEAAKFIQSSYEDFMNGEIDAIVLVHNGYVNKIVQEIKINQLLPLEFKEKKNTDHILDIEPKHDEEKVLEELVQKYVEFSQFFALLDSLAAEHSARMQAMDAATNNASEKVKELTLQYNKARQEAVTTELIEIISGMEALK
ncbi:MAG: F0F1 ATP synthase subunit gamma [Epsilonproteobacteria bacterium]|nr:F0F1 ATP synthase subunit gamma [Campylobacterota bacterium]